ncbi:MAG: hypothetical protein LE168_01990 [Endomicrobium sp.]|nr:hypothetical protein [Endomicrobium sp.]
MAEMAEAAAREEREEAAAMAQHEIEEAAKNRAALIARLKAQAKDMNINQENFDYAIRRQDRAVYELHTDRRLASIEKSLKDLDKKNISFGTNITDINFTLQDHEDAKMLLLNDKSENFARARELGDKIEGFNSKMKEFDDKARCLNNKIRDDKSELKSMIKDVDDKINKNEEVIGGLGRTVEDHEDTKIFLLESNIDNVAKIEELDGTTKSMNAEMIDIEEGLVATSGGLIKAIPVNSEEQKLERDKKLKEVENALKELALRKEKL